jgi:hypothetical protein
MADGVEVKEGKTTSEWKALIGGGAAVLLTLIPNILELIPTDSLAALIVGIVALVCVYVGGRGWVKGKASDAVAAKALAAAQIANSKPPNP